MNIDSETKLNHLNIVFDDSPKFLKELREQAIDDCQNDDLQKGKPKKLSMTLDKSTFEMDEYYFDPSEKEIVVTGTTQSTKGTVYISFSIPLSDEVLVDILEYSMNKFDKLKNVLESLK